VTKAEAVVNTQNNQWSVSLVMNDEGAKEWEEFTSEQACQLGHGVGMLGVGSLLEPVLGLPSTVTAGEEPSEGGHGDRVARRPGRERLDEVSRLSIVETFRVQHPEVPVLDVPQDLSVVTESIVYPGDPVSRDKLRMDSVGRARDESWTLTP
jgi:hypothetical protein